MAEPEPRAAAGVGGHGAGCSRTWGGSAAIRRRMAAPPRRRSIRAALGWRPICWVPSCSRRCCRHSRWAATVNRWLLRWDRRATMPAARDGALPGVDLPTHRRRSRLALGGRPLATTASTTGPLADYDGRARCRGRGALVQAADVAFATSQSLVAEKRQRNDRLTIPLMGRAMRTSRAHRPGSSGCSRGGGLPWPVPRSSACSTAHPHRTARGAG